MVGQPGFFDLEDRLAGLSKTGNPLERLARVVDFEIFRSELDRALGRSERAAKGGRPPSDAVLMFKILVLQALYGMSDEQAEYQIQDRLTFMRFLGLGLGDKVRSSVEHVFAEQKARMGLFIRTVGIARATIKIGLANLAYNMRRLIWLETASPAT